MSDLSTEIPNEIIRVVTGSRLYGTNVASSDEDFMSVFVETPRQVFVGPEAKKLTLRNHATGERSEAGDVEGEAYPLRHFVRLAASGNPSVLTILFAQDEHVLASSAGGDRLLRNRDFFVSKQAIGKFLGYMRNQKARIRGEKKGHIPKRPELVEKYGFDTKYAGHVVRLGFQGVEFISTGNITLPMNPVERQVCLDVREGKYTEDEAFQIMDALEQLMLEAEETCTLPDEPDWAGISQIVSVTHYDIWKEDYLNGR